MQMDYDPRDFGDDFATAKQTLHRRLEDLAGQLDRLLAQQYGVKPDKPEFAKWRESHQPFHWFAEFYGIVKRGGFGVILGNPPYVEYRVVRNQYELLPSHFLSEEAANLYAYCMERSCELLHLESRFGMIVPAGLMGLDKATKLRKVLLDAFRTSHCSTYGIRPSKLFDGVDQRLCIYLGSRNPQRSLVAKIHATKFHHWNSEERASLLQLLSFAQSTVHKRLDRIPQLGSGVAVSVLMKLDERAVSTISSHFAASSRDGFLLHYHRSPRYWIRSMDFEQYFRSPTRSRSVYHFRDLYFRNARAGKIVGAILNSSLFYFWFITVGNGRNLTGTDIELFPVGDIGISQLNNLPALFDSLMNDYQLNSVVRQRSDCEYQEFHPSKSKSVLDDIDRVLAHHYGFTGEEFDFIINYEIKYRMGDALDDDSKEAQ
jgi:hypothetical protein